MNSKSLSTAHIACVKILLECIAKKDYKIEYGKIVDEISISPNKIGSVLGDISTICHELGLPFISVMVVQKNTNVCGSGFFELCEKLNIHAKCNELLEEVKKCIHWNILADYFKIIVFHTHMKQSF